MNLTRLRAGLVAAVLIAVGAQADAQIFAPKPAPVQKPIPVLQPPQPGFVYPAKQTLTFSRRLASLYRREQRCFIWSRWATQRRFRPRRIRAER